MSMNDSWAEEKILYLLSTEGLQPHANTHAATGGDPITPLSINAVEYGTTTKKPIKMGIDSDECVTIEY